MAMHASTGFLALLVSTSFLLQAKPSVLHRSKEGATPGLEVSGPVLPQQLKQLCSLLKDTQGGSFHLNCDVHEPTAVFNTVANDADCEPTTLRSVSCSAGSYSFSKLT